MISHTALVCTTLSSTTSGLRKGAWTQEEDNLLRKCIHKYGEGKWHQVPIRAGLSRCRKSCRLRWLNYLRPDIKRGDFDLDEVDLIVRLHKLLGNKWSLIAGRLPGRTANDVKNYWNTHLLKKIAARRELEVGHRRNMWINGRLADNNINRGKTIRAIANNVIKPRPWNFFRNASRMKGKTTSSTETTPVSKYETHVKNSLPTTSSVQTEKGNNTSIQYWWDNLFLDKEAHEDPTWTWPFAGGSPGSGEHHTTNLLSEESSKLQGDCNVQEGQIGSSYFSSHFDLWDLLNSDHQQEILQYQS